MSSAVRIIGGFGDWRYEYMPNRLALPPSTRLHNAHGFALDDDGDLILSYEHVGGGMEDARCLVRWHKADAYTQAVGFGPGLALCAGVPHGLTLAHDADGTQHLYHANAQGRLHKTTLNGTIVWTASGPPVRTPAFRNAKFTWIASPPGSPFLYVSDGYGSNFVHAYHSESGRYAQYSFGGPRKFKGCHTVDWDPRARQLVVCDRENHRIQFFTPDGGPSSPNVSFRSMLAIPELTRPCHLRAAPDGVHAVVPDLLGPVGILNASNALVSLVDVGQLLGHLGHAHPHDALLLPNGDLVVGTWNPGRLSYWRRLRRPPDKLLGRTSE